MNTPFNRNCNRPPFFSPRRKKRKKPVELISPHWKVKNMEGFSALHWLALRSMDEDSHVEVGVLGDCGKGKRASVQTENGHGQWHLWPLRFNTVIHYNTCVHFCQNKIIYCVYKKLPYILIEYAILVPCFVFFWSTSSFKNLSGGGSMSHSLPCFGGTKYRGRCMVGWEVQWRVQFRLGERWEVGSCKMYVYVHLFIYDYL